MKPLVASPRVASPHSPAVFFRALRIFFGWSREDLGHRASLPPWRIARLEAGAVPTATELDALWSAFNAERRTPVTAPSAWRRPKVETPSEVAPR